MFASKYGHTEIVKSLLEHDPYPNIVPIDDSEATALIAASAEGHFDVVKLLLESHEDARIIDKHGRTALMRAEKQKHGSIVQLLKGK